MAYYNLCNNHGFVSPIGFAFLGAKNDNDPTTLLDVSLSLAYNGKQKRNTDTHHIVPWISSFPASL
jgi:hypothetical protein